MIRVELGPWPYIAGGQGGLLPPPKNSKTKYMLSYRGYPQKALQKGFCPPAKDVLCTALQVIITKGIRIWYSDSRTTLH